MDWQKIDPKMVAKSVKQPDNYAWLDPKEPPFRVSGLNWFSQDKRYIRFPASSLPMLHDISTGVEFLCTHPAGGQVAFETDAGEIIVAAKLAGVSDMHHFAATGQCGIDCYAAYPGEDYRFERVVTFDKSKNEYASPVFSGPAGVRKRIILNLPLYIGLESLLIGIPHGSAVFAPAPFSSPRPLVFYGTSITQGGCATRPGMLYTNIISRHFNREIFNYGFSGSGKGEPEVAKLISEVRDPAVYVINYEANADDSIRDTLAGFIGIIRKAHPAVPILVISRLHIQYELHISKLKVRRDSLRDFQRECVAKLAAAGDPNIYFMDGRELLKHDPDECFVDGDHPTDLGFWQIADALEPVLRRIIL